VGGGYRAFLLIDNPNASSVQCGVGFRTGSGLALSLLINGVAGNSAAFTIPAMGSIKLTLTDPGQQIKTGWAQVFANRPVAGVLIYQLLDGSTLVSSASVLPSPRMIHFSM